jgi:hypothetical protein
MNFLKARLTRNRSGGMLVKWTEVSSELELLMNVDLLVTEDCPSNLSERPSRNANHYHSQTAPRSATRRALQHA